MATKLPPGWGYLILLAIAVVIVVIPSSNPPDYPPVSQTSNPTARAPVKQDWELVRTLGTLMLVHVDKTSENDRSVYERAIASLCKYDKFCFIRFWSTRALVPARLPMSDAEADAQVADYGYNPNTGYDRLLLSCKIEKDPSKCFNP